MKLVTCRKACEVLGIHGNTLRRWAEEGRIGYVRAKGRKRLYDVEGFLKKGQGVKSRRDVCYCRVSSPKQKDDLARQVKYMSDKFPEHDIVSDVASGLNFKRKGLLSLLESVSSGDVGEIVVAHRDRLCRFGFELIRWLCDKHDTRLVVLDESSMSPSEELAQDVLAVLGVFSARMHGLRKYRDTIKKDKDLSKP